jgi:hypothetical protein
MDCEALTAELVDDAQHPERLAIVSAVSDEVIGPDMVRLFGRDLQPLTPPDPLNGSNGQPGQCG